MAEANDHAIRLNSTDNKRSSGFSMIHPKFFIFILIFSIGTTKALAPHSKASSQIAKQSMAMPAGLGLGMTMCLEIDVGVSLVMRSLPDSCWSYQKVCLAVV